jgi:hypothetical protein
LQDEKDMEKIQLKTQPQIKLVQGRRCKEEMINTFFCFFLSSMIFCFVSLLDEYGFATSHLLSIVAKG